MVTTHNLGFPRIGRKRELKFTLEKYWRSEITQPDLNVTTQSLRAKNWLTQQRLDWQTVGDFSLYDHVLDTSFLFGNIPKRFETDEQTVDTLTQYFQVARGRSEQHGISAHAGEMTKWFNTNYHYIVPEFDADTVFTLNPERLFEQISEAQQQGFNVKPVILGPVSYLWLGKCQDKSNCLDLLDKLLDCYAELFHHLEEKGLEWIQIDEPILVMELDQHWQHAFRKVYFQLQSTKLKLLLTTYFGQLQNNLKLACELPVNGLHIDAINARDEIDKIIDWLPVYKILSLGVVDGRNIWRTDLGQTISWLEPVHQRLQDRLWLAPSCSLLHVPVDLQSERRLDTEIQSWLAFAVQKLEEIEILANALNQGVHTVQDQLQENATAIQHRQQSKRVHKSVIQEQLQQINPAMAQRNSPYSLRILNQRKRLKLPLFPTTTIGSFPQTSEIRHARKQYRNGDIDENEYRNAMQREIEQCIHVQEEIGLDVLVHGEPERNDMVEYFGEQLDGYAFTQCGWVQSYGSRCVKPPIIYGDIQRQKSMTIEWIKYAQSFTQKPVKAMLTGPVTMLNWSFVRDDQSRSTTCLQLALAIREEVLELEQAGITIIQIDEAALREGLPLREFQWSEYLKWSVQAFKLSANAVSDETQIHTHMCYSEFNEIIEAIADMDADVITIETSRSSMELLTIFDEFQYPNDIGPGVYDIHSPIIPTQAQMVGLMKKAAQRIPLQRLWVNPDCGLKTRQWSEVKPALEHLVGASKELREIYAGDQVNNDTNWELSKANAAMDS